MARDFYDRRNPDKRAALLKTKAYQSEIKKRRESVLAVRATTLRMIARILTKKQFQNYQKMLGDPFSLDKLSAAPGPPEPSEPKNAPSEERAAPPASSPRRSSAGRR